MKMVLDRPDVETLAAVIAHSQIVVAAPVEPWLAGFDDVDLAILDWLVAEARLTGRGSDLLM
jgi:hypothetical protein